MDYRRHNIQENVDCIMKWFWVQFVNQFINLFNSFCALKTLIISMPFKCKRTNCFKFSPKIQVNACIMYFPTKIQSIVLK